MAERGEFPLPRQALERLAFPHGGIAADVIYHLRRQHEKSAADPTTVTIRFFDELRNHVLLDVHRAEAARWLDGRHGSKPVLRLVESDEGGHVDVGESVAIGEAEILIAEIRAGALQAAAGHGVLSGIYQRHPPR